MDVVGLVLWALGAVVLLAILLGCAFNLADVSTAESVRHRLLAERLVSEARVQRLTDQTTDQLLRVAREELLRQAQPGTVRVRQAWESGHG